MTVLERASAGSKQPRAGCVSRRLARFLGLGHWSASERISASGLVKPCQY
jgi:hypothetical protein